MKITKVLSNLITEDARFQVLYKQYVLPSGDRKKGILPFEIVRDIVFTAPTTRPQDYDVESANLERACALTPGIESPTISPLQKSDWNAVRAMVKRSEINRIMDELWQVGARGILVTDIHACRL